MAHRPSQRFEPNYLANFKHPLLQGNHSDGVAWIVWWMSVFGQGMPLWTRWVDGWLGGWWGMDGWLSGWMGMGIVLHSACWPRNQYGGVCLGGYTRVLNNKIVSFVIEIPLIPSSRKLAWLTEHNYFPYKLQSQSELVFAPALSAWSEFTKHKLNSFLLFLVELIWDLLGCVSDLCQISCHFITSNYLQTQAVTSNSSVYSAISSMLVFLCYITFSLTRTVLC